MMTIGVEMYIPSLLLVSSPILVIQRYSRIRSSSFFMSKLEKERPLVWYAFSYRPVIIEYRVEIFIKTWLKSEINTQNDCLLSVSSPSKKRFHKEHHQHEHSQHHMYQKYTLRSLHGLFEALLARCLINMSYCYRKRLYDVHGKRI
jgi:hypothetical protein